MPSMLWCHHEIRFEMFTEHDVEIFALHINFFNLTLNRPGGGIRPQAGSSLCCAESVSSRKLKLCDFYYILIGLNSVYKPVPRRAPEVGNIC